METMIIPRGYNFLILAVGLNNIPHEPAASMQLYLTLRSLSNWGKIRQVNETIGQYNAQTTGSRLLIDEPSLAFHRDNLHLHGKSKAIVAEKLSCIFDSFIATLT